MSENIRFDSGDLQPLRGFSAESQLIGSTTSAVIGNLFWLRIGDQSRLIGFGEDYFVTGGRGPVPNDQYQRWYWCIQGGALNLADRGLRAVTFPNGVGDLPGPDGVPVNIGSHTAYRDFAGYRVGIPPPNVAPVISAVESVDDSVGSGTEIAIETVSQTNPITINLSDDHGFNDGDRVRIVISESLPKPDEADPPEEGVPPEGGDEDDGPSIGQIWALDGFEGIVGNSGPAQFDIRGVSGVPFEEFHEQDLAAMRVERVYGTENTENRYYVFTYLNEFGEEGPPSPASNVLVVPNRGTVKIELSDESFNAVAHGGSRDFVNRIRIYRSLVTESGQALLVEVGDLNLVGGGSAQDSLVWETAPAAPPELAWTGEALDSTDSLQVGDPIRSKKWYPPRPSLEGIVQLPNGIMAGWEGSAVYFSEPYLPHAWDADNFVTLTDDVVAMEAFGTTLVAATRGRPYLIQGVDPASMVARKMEDEAPCRGPRAITDIGIGVAYVSDHGLVLVGPGGVQRLTRNIHNEHTWREATENRDRLAFQKERLILYGPTETKALVFSINQGSVEQSRFNPDAFGNIPLRAHARSDERLAMLTGTRTVRWFNEGDRLLAGWRSGRYTFRRPVNFAVAQVLADGYDPIDLDFTIIPFQIRIRYLEPGSYPDTPAGQPSDELIEATIEVNGPEPFRLPAGFLSRDYEVFILTGHRVERVVIATSMDELVQT